jgi:hypothetical protein
MVGSRKKIAEQKKPVTVLERLGGKPGHVVDLGKKGSSRAERKPGSNFKPRSSRQA